MPLCFEHQLYLATAAGLPRAAALAAQRAAAPLFEAVDWAHPEALAAVRRMAEGCSPKAARATPVRWPSAGGVAALAKRLAAERIGLVWRGGAGYPIGLSERLGAPPPWVWIGGDAARLGGVACSVVGSRRTSGPLLKAAVRLGEALANAGAAVISGWADGADTAAHAGAARGEAGTVAAPACGLLALDAVRRRAAGPAWTLLGAEPLFSPFSAGLAVRRNALIAALGDGLVLVASGLHGGSAYAVRHALEAGAPLWCFEAGRATPPANRQLLRAGKAMPLSLADSPEAWAEAMLPALQKRRRALLRSPREAQLDFLAA